MLVDLRSCCSSPLLKRAFPLKQPKTLLAFQVTKGHISEQVAGLCGLTMSITNYPTSTIFLLESSNLLQSSFNGFIVETCEVERQAT